MKYGHFDDVHQEYVITTPKTPLPWINYLGCNEFFSLISNTCGGYTFYKDAKLLRLTRYRYNNVPADINGKYSPIQTQADGEKKVVNTDPAAVPTDEAKKKVANQAESKATNGRQFANCTEAFESGVFNIRRSDPSYQQKLDRDNDGIACEK